MPIIRARTGCRQCRQRKKKCDEKKPICTACLRLGLSCEPNNSTFRFVDESQLNKKTTPAPTTRPPQPRLPLDDSDLDDSKNPNSSNTTVHSGVNATYSTGIQSFLPQKNHAASIPSLGDQETSTVELWFSSFVDFNGPTISTRKSSSFKGTWMHGIEKERDDEYYKLQEKLYMLHWHQKLVDVLPGTYRYIGNIINGCPALQPAMVALAACDIARLNVEVRCYTRGHSVQWDFGMNKEHESHAYTWYNKAVDDFARMEYDKQNKVAVLATLLLFTHIETRIGSFRGAAFHHHGIEHLLSSDDTICETPVGRALAATWVFSRSHNWSYRVPYTLLGFEKTLGRLGVDINLVLDPCKACDEAIAVIMLQSWYLSLMLQFEHYAGRGDMESISSKCVRDVYHSIKNITPGEMWQPKVPITDENYGELLNQQRIKLEQWHTALPLSQLPIQLANVESEPHQLPELDIPLVVAPRIKFHSQRAAITYAYYIVARIVQCSEILNEYLTMEDPDNKTGEVDSKADHWLQMLFQVVASLDIPTCVKYCSYTVGLCQLIRMCQLRLRLPRYNVVICRLADYLTMVCSENCIPDDGHVNLSNFHHEFKEIEDQRAQGKDLFYIMPRFSPDEGIQANPPDFTRLPAVIYGRNRATGKLFCDILDSSS